MDLTFYGDDNKGLIKLDPRTKILMFLASGLVTLSSYSDIGVTAVSVLLISVYALCGKPFSALKTALAFGMVLYLKLVLNTSKGAPPLLIMLISALTTIFMFGFPTIMSMIILVKTTKINQFLFAFQAMHLPVKAVVPFAVFFRFLPTVAEEWNGIRNPKAYFQHFPSAEKREYNAICGQFAKKRFSYVFPLFWGNKEQIIVPDLYKFQK